MFEYIDKLRKKPEAQRRKFVLAVSLSVFFVMLALWGVSLVVKIRGGDFGLIEEGSSASSVRQKLEDVKEAWSRFIDQAGDAFEQREPATPVEEPKAPEELNATP